MQIVFKLKERPAGISLNFAVEGEIVKVMTTDRTKKNPKNSRWIGGKKLGGGFW